MTWLYNSIHGPVFRICPECGCVYRIEEGENPYNYCPNCGIDLKGNE